jgi:hypothetical protein
MAYKLLLGVAELGAGLTLIVPAFDPLPRFHRWATAERIHDPNDLLAGFVVRNVPSFLPHRILVVLILLILGLAKVVAAVAMFYGYEWGVLLLIGIVTAALPVDIRAAVTHPSIGHAMFVTANVVVVALLVMMHRRQIARNAEESSA